MRLIPWLALRTPTTNCLFAIQLKWHHERHGPLENQAKPSRTASDRDQFRGNAVQALADSSFLFRIEVAKQRLEEVGRLRQNFNSNVRRGIEPGQLLGFGHGIVQRAELVDEAVFLGLTTRVHPAAR